MNPLKSLMALGFALALSRPAFCLNDQFSTREKGQSTTLSGNNSSIETPQATAVHDGKGGEEDGPLKVVAAALAKNIPAAADVGARFADYLVENHYIDAAYAEKAKAEAPKFFENMQKAVQSALVSEKVTPDNAKMDRVSEVAALYIMIGPGSQKPTWLPAALVEALGSQKIRQGTWPTNFEAGMRCWRGDTSGEKPCGAKAAPFGGNAGAKGKEDDFDSWVLGVTKDALTVAENVVADKRGEKEITASIGAHDEGDGVLVKGSGKGRHVGFSGGDFGADDLYVDGAVYNDCLVVDTKNNHCRKMSMKLVYNRFPDGTLEQAVTVCDITLPGVRGGTGCETVAVSDSKDIMLAGGVWHVGFTQSYEGKGMGISLTLKSDDSVKMETSLGELQDKLGKQAEDWSAQGRCKARIGSQNYVCVPFAHTLNVDDGGGNPVEVARGGLMYFPADDKFKLLGKPPKPLFTADNTQSANGQTVKLTPPNTALGCAGFGVNVTENKDHTREAKLSPDADFCNKGMDAADHFMYLMQNDEGIYVAVSCKDAQKPVFKDKGYKGVDCKFPVPPAKKEVVSTPPAKGSAGGEGASGPAGPDQKPGQTDSGAKSGDVRACDGDKMAAQYQGYKPLKAGPWTYLVNAAGPGNDDRLCLDDTTWLLALKPPYVLDMIEDGHHEDGKDRVSIVMVLPNRYISYDDRQNGGVILNPSRNSHDEPLQWESGGRKTAITGRVTYFVPAANLGDAFLKGVDEQKFKAQGQHLLPTVDDIADYSFVQSKVLSGTDADQMWITLPKGANAGQAYDMVTAGFKFGPAQNHTHFTSDEELGLLKSALASALGSQKAGSDAAKITVQLRWEKECSNQAPTQPLLVNSLPQLTYNCDTGKIQATADFQSYMDQKAKH